MDALDVDSLLGGFISSLRPQSQKKWHACSKRRATLIRKRRAAIRKKQHSTEQRSSYSVVGAEHRRRAEQLRKAIRAAACGQPAPGAADMVESMTSLDSFLLPSTTSVSSDSDFMACMCQMEEEKVEMLQQQTQQQEKQQQQQKQKQEEEQAQRTSRAMSSPPVVNHHHAFALQGHMKNSFAMDDTLGRALVA